VLRIPAPAVRCRHRRRERAQPEVGVFDHRFEHGSEPGEQGDDRVGAEQVDVVLGGRAQAVLAVPDERIRSSCVVPDRSRAA
jgi:hypothetical protein